MNVDIFREDETRDLINMSWQTISPLSDELKL